MSRFCVRYVERLGGEAVTGLEGFMTPPPPTRKLPYYLAACLDIPHTLVKLYLKTVTRLRCQFFPKWRPADVGMLRNVRLSFIGLGKH